MYCSLKQSRPSSARVGPEPTKLGDVFTGGVGLGTAADPAGCRLRLPPGPYLIGLAGIAAWKWSGELVVRIVVAGDLRFAAPRSVLSRDHTAAEAARMLRLHEAELAGRVPGSKPDPLRAMRQSFAASGVVVLGDQAAVEVWAAAPGDAAPGDGEVVTFEGVEVFAYQLQEGTK